MNTFIYPYKAGSNSAIALAQAFNTKVLRLTNSNFKPSMAKTIINWGSTTMPLDYEKGVARVVNPAAKVRLASNKKTFFELVAQSGEAGPRIPPFTTDKDVALGWLEASPTALIFARTVLAGHSGEGIVKVSTKEELAAIKAGTLLCLYVPKRREFRLHVGLKSGVFSIQEKKAKLDAAVAVDYQIRNLDNGFIFARNNLKDIPGDVVVQAKKALAVTGLDFGAIDIIFNSKQEQAYVLEVNTAPGLEGTTLEDYCAALSKELGTE